MLMFSKNFIVSNTNTNEVYKQQLGIAIALLAICIFPQFLMRVPQGFLLSQLKNQTVRGLELSATIFLWGGSVLISLIGIVIYSLEVSITVLRILAQN